MAARPGRAIAIEFMADFALGQQRPTVVRCMRKAEVWAGWQVCCQLCPPAGVCLSCRQSQRLAAHNGWSSTPAAAEDCRLWTAADLHPTSRTGHTGGGPAVRSPPWQVDPPWSRSSLEPLHNSLRIISPPQLASIQRGIKRT